MIPWWWHPEPMWYIIMILSIAVLIGLIGVAFGDKL